MPTNHRRAAVSSLLVALAALLLAGCSGTGPTSSGTSEFAAAATAALESAAAAPTAAPAAEFAATPLPEATPPPEAAALPASSGDAAASAPPVAPNDPSRKIIKDATMTIEVASVDIALSRVIGAATQAGGYVLETRTDTIGANQKQAVLKLAVPVDQFEAMLQRIRESGSVLSEAASGTDATQEFVDVQSQLANLEATQARIRQFLDQAKTVEEALQVNAQLTDIEGQIGQIKGRLQFLTQRAAYSTITAQLQQPPPPTPTASPTPTATPTATPEPLWNPGKTTTQATTALTTIVQSLATIVIWLAIVVLPLALPVLLIALIVRWLRRRKVTP